MKSHSVNIKVPFHDVDAMGIAWHGHYLKYFEIARCELLETIGYGYAQMKDSGYSWPVIGASVRYARPAAFGQGLRITATIAEWENRLRIEYEVTDQETGQRLTTGNTVQVAVDLASRETCFGSPRVLFERLGVPYP